ncbi:MAG: CD225/dispanin family protein [Muribaculaceae bacterium]|nr:CD225/dispanin family protein [Muribaculaceae bacterium]
MKYWIMLNGVRLGPLTLEEARALPLLADTPVWRTGLPEWTTAGELPEFAANVARDETEPPRYSATEHGISPVYPDYRREDYSQQKHDDEKPPMPDNYLPWAIVVTLCCCLVGGIVAIIYSSKVSQLYNQEDYAGAQRASKTALTWIWISVASGIILQPLLFLLQIGSMNALDYLGEF